MIPSERLKGIEAFVSTADAGSFTAAGVRLNLTNSAVSKSVARLEARLGSRLFERTTRRLKLTDVGAAFYETCVRVLEDLADAEAVLAALKANARYLRGEVAKGLATKYTPDLSFRLDESFDAAARIDTILRRPEIARDLGGE